MSNIFYHNDEQKKLAEESKSNREKLIGKFVSTNIKIFDKFYLAEVYHQKYYLKLNDDLFLELRTIYPDPNDLTNSTAAAKINGVLGDFIDRDYYFSIRDDLGLSNEAKSALDSRFQ